MSTCTACAGSRVPAPPPPWAQATTRRHSPATSSPSSRRCKPAAFLRHVPGSPRLGLLRRPRPLPPPSADAAPRLPGRASAEAGGSHVHCRSIGGVVPSYAPAGLPRRSRSRSPRSRAGRMPAAAGRSPPNPGGARAPHGRPVSIGFEPATSLAGVLPLDHLRCTVPPRLPRPRSPVVPARRVVVRAACHPRPQLRGQAALSFTGPLRLARTPAR